MTDYVQVTTTTANAAEAEGIATALVALRLAACVQIIPQLQSVYRWRDKVERAEECLCLLKTRRSLLPQVEVEIHRRHSYECPEFIAVPIEAGSLAYLAWLDEQLA